MTSTPDPQFAAAPPIAEIRPARRSLWFIWLIPLGALLFAGWLAYHAWLTHGTVVTISLNHGHGLQVGDDVRHRGIVVGSVRAVSLAEDLTGVQVKAALNTESAGLARVGTRFWVVRPVFGVTGVDGLETVIGPRYLAVDPGDGSPQRRFVGLEEPPIDVGLLPGGLEVNLVAAQRGGLSAGAPVLYRQVPVGKVLSVGLTSDGGAVESRVYVEPAYTGLIRQSTRFWNVSGMQAGVGFGGLSLRLDSLEAVLAGGVALATPPGDEPTVRTGHRFPLVAEPKEEWLDWEPLVAIGSSYLPPGAPLPAPERAVVGWDPRSWLRSRQSRHGWVLQTEAGLLGPTDLLTPRPIDTGESKGEPATLEAAGRTFPLAQQPLWTQAGAVVLPLELPLAAWPLERCRRMETAEDCLAVADPAAAPLPLAASRLNRSGEGWLVDPAISVEEAWHGACVLARDDGRLVGLLLIEDDAVRVVPVPNPDTLPDSP
jgi:paraquat-inducible protein B